MKRKTLKRKATAAATSSSSDDPEETRNPANQETGSEFAVDDEKGVTSEANGTLHIYMLYRSLMWIMTVADIDETSQSLYKHDCFLSSSIFRFLFVYIIILGRGRGGWQR